MLHSILFTIVTLPGLGSAQAPQDSRLRLQSEHIATRTDAAGRLELVALSPGGRANTSIPAYSLERERAVLGPQSSLALLERDPRGPSRRVRLLDRDFREQASFEVRSKLTLQLGGEGLLLHQAKDHGAGTRYELEFRDLFGNPMGLVVREDLVLIKALALGQRSWASISVDPSGEYQVHAYSSLGELLFERPGGRIASPVVAASPLGERFAIGRLEAELASSQLEVIDDTGRTLGSSSVPAAQALFFSADGARLAARGSHSLSYLESDTARLIWSHPSRERLALGQSVAFAPGGRQLYAIGYQAQEDGSPADFNLLRFFDPDSNASPQVRALNELEGRTERRILALDRRGPGRWQLVTEAGLWTLRN